MDVAGHDVPTQASRMIVFPGRSRRMKTGRINANCPLLSALEMLARCALPTVFWVLIGASARRMIPRQTSAQWQPAQPNRVTNLNTVQRPPHSTVIQQIDLQAGVGKLLAIRLRGLSVPRAQSAGAAKNVESRHGSKTTEWSNSIS